MSNAANILQKRSCPVEIRARGRRLEGYAATFGAEARIAPGLVETIRPGAFSQSLAEREDILALVDHDPSRLLARTKSGTLRLSEDAKGLAFDLDVPDTQAGHDVLALATRGDLGGMSFGFHVLDELVNGSRRELRAVELIEISIVLAFPAYGGTSVQARTMPLDTPYRAWAHRALKLLEMGR